MSIRDFKSFLEKNLNLDELKKPSKNGGLRGDILVKKIDNEEPMTLSTGDEVVVNTEVDEITDGDHKYSPDKAKDFLKKPSGHKNAPYLKRFTDEEGNEYKLTDFVKVEEFSDREQGSSLGTKGTRIVESIQTLILAYKQEMLRSGNYKYLNVNIFDEDDIFERIIQLKDKSAFISSVEFDDEILNKFSGWFPTFVKTANAFVHKENKGILLPQIYYNFYQISHSGSFMKSLNDAYNRCCRSTMGISKGRVINMAKWTPCDIWAINESKELEIIQKLNNRNLITNIVDLNSLIDDLFDSRDLVGLSLKKLPNDEKHRPFPIIINKQEKRPNYTIENFVFSKSPFTKSIKIVLNRNLKKYNGKDSITIRNFTSGISNIGIEIDGVSSRQGKLTSFDTINKYLGEKGIPKLTSAKKLDEKLSKSQLIRKITSLDKRLKKTNVSNKRGRLGDVDSISKEALVCKYQALLFAQLLLECLQTPRGRSKVNSVINSMMYYALSIQNDFFECPKYARVIDY